MRMAPLLSIAALSLWPTFVHAADETMFTLKTTEDLYQVCTTPADDPVHREAINFCEGFILGAVSYHDAITDKHNLKPLVCYPPGVTRDEGVQAFIDWAAGHQADKKFMDDPPIRGAVRGLAHKWPCKES